MESSEEFRARMAEGFLECMVREYRKRENDPTRNSDIGAYAIGWLRVYIGELERLKEMEGEHRGQ